MDAIEHGKNKTSKTNADVKQKKHTNMLGHPPSKNNAKHAATLANILTPRTCMRAPRTYTLHNMHVKRTRQTERKTKKKKHINIVK